MRRERKWPAACALLLAFCLLFGTVSSAAVFPFETQFEYEEAALGWLTDFVVKEDMESVPGVAAVNTLTARPAYPYTETAASFQEDVSRFLELYTLREDGLKASYIYLFELLGSNASIFAAQISDSAVRSYLENVGVRYDVEPDTDMRVLAKALYAAMITGAFSGLTEEDLAAGISLQKALVKYVSSLSGIRDADVVRFAPAGTSSLSEYLLAASRYTLWSNGYSVDEDTPETRVTALMAVMTVRSLGIRVNDSISFEELQSVYTAALLGRKYNVTVEPGRLAAAVSQDNTAFYILQLIGQKNGLVIREDGMSYAEAFEMVAKNTDLFSIEDGEFYADIYDYDLTLKARRSAVWVYPTSYAGADENALVSITVNGKTAVDNEFTKVEIDPDAPEQPLKIRVEVSRYAETDVKVYTVRILSPEAETQTPGANGADSEKYDSAETIVAEIMRGVGVNEGVVKATDNLIAALPDGLKNAMNFIAPTFGTQTDTPQTDTQETRPETFIRNEDLFKILDKLGAVSDLKISGIEGLTLAGIGNTASAYNFITFE